VVEHRDCASLVYSQLNNHYSAGLQSAFQKIIGTHSDRPRPICETARSELSLDSLQSVHWRHLANDDEIKTCFTECLQF